jgi:hypothetical protein
MAILTSHDHPVLVAIRDIPPQKSRDDEDTIMDHADSDRLS